MAIIANKDDDLKYKKQQIELFFSVHSDTQERADYLKSAYQDRYTEIMADGQRLGYKPQEDGLLMWEGSYLSRTKESVFSWELVAEWTAQLIDKKEYFIQTDIRSLPTQEGQQMSLFDFAAFHQSKPEDGKQLPLFSHTLPQQVIDEALCLGANDRNSRLAICAYFKRISRTTPGSWRSIMGRTARASIWVEKICPLVQCRGNPHCRGRVHSVPAPRSFHGSRRQPESGSCWIWGRYMPQSELDRVDHYEVHELADRLLLMFRDIEDEEKRFSPRCAPSMINRADSRRQRKKSQGCLAGKMAYRPSSLNMKCLPQPTRRTRTLCGSVFTVRLRSRHSLQIYSGSRCTYRRRRIRPTAAFLHFRG